MGQEQLGAHSGRRAEAGLRGKSQWKLGISVFLCLSLSLSLSFSLELNYILTFSDSETFCLTLETSNFMKLFHFEV